MIVSKSRQMMRRSFEKTTYRFCEVPEADFRGNFGVYIHVPFCRTKCTFCPFYKELFSEDLKRRYLDAIVEEIGRTPMSGRAKWVYMGGGTPNTLSVQEVGRIVEGLRAKVRLGSVGMELLPSLLDEGYLRGLKRLGFTKVSMGVESFSGEVGRETGRRRIGAPRVEELVKQAMSLGLWVNVDMMAGLPKQDAATFAEDIRKIAAVGPSQVTIYPYMVIRGVAAAPSMPEDDQFALIEGAAGVLESRGYGRRGVWTFAVGQDVYDSSRDELVEDYAGFGPSGFSTYGGWKVVNPELEVYLRNIETGRRMGFVAPKSRATDDWRRFARMIYDLKGRPPDGLPLYIRLYVRLLRLAGYIRGGALTAKGRLFAHAITKTVVESLPFPIQNPACVENYGEYLSFKMNAEPALSPAQGGTSGDRHA